MPPVPDPPPVPLGTPDVLDEQLALAIARAAAAAHKKWLGVMHYSFPYSPRFARMASNALCASPKPGSRRKVR